MTDRIEIQGPVLELRLGSAHQAAYDEAARIAEAERWAERLHGRDASLWSADEGVQEAIADRLGWLDAPDHFTEQIPALEGFGDAIKNQGFTAVVVGGMGGSSLAADVLRRTFGTADGWLDLRILDSTDPAYVAATVDDLDPLKTLFIVATKSGTTTEPLAFQADAWARIKAALHENHRGKPGDYMVAITDPGKSVDAIPHHDDLGELFLNPPDIGGRYSALTYVGLVPASLIGLDLDPLLASAVAVLGDSRDNATARNPSLALGLALGVLARDGRDKLTIVADPELASFGAWLEQLIAESTGKQGVGIVPVDLEPLGEVGSYGSDRAFVRLAVAGSDGARTAGGASADDLIDALAGAGHPVIRIEIPEVIDIGGEFVRWEVATAIAGAVLAIDPFDQPNVEEAKENTRRLLDTIGDAAPSVTHADGTNVAELRRRLARLKPNGYVALQAYIAPTPARDAAFAALRTLLRDATGRATTLGYGPRFLHSTGQLHKGGPATGWFIQLTADHPADREIPGWPYTFGQLIDAQARGDFQTLEAHDLPILRVHLGEDPDAGLAELHGLLTEALRGEGATA